MNTNLWARVLAGSLLSLLFSACSQEHASSHEEPAAASHEHGDADEHDEAGHDRERGADAHGHEEGEDLARIDAETAREQGVQVTTAEPARIAEAVTLTGRLIVDPRRVSQVRARFAGPVRRVHKDVGDVVNQGDVLAAVESNESLTVYEVRSPMNGVVLERMANAGDVALDEPLFRIGDVAALQAELRAFSRDQSRIRRGAEAVVLVREREVRGEVVNLVPELDTRTQALRVRVGLTSNEPLQATTGQFVTARILVGDGSDAAVAVPLDAIQRLNGREVIFVPEPEGFAARDVTLGRRDHQRAEVVEGLAPGERYVSGGAFLLKAEIGKHGAGHEH